MKCINCGSEEGVEKHHVVPRSCGGKGTAGLCCRCHKVAHGLGYSGVSTSELTKRGIDKQREFLLFTLFLYREYGIDVFGAAQCGINIYKGYISPYTPRLIKRYEEIEGTEYAKEMFKRLGWIPDDVWDKVVMGGIRGGKTKEEIEEEIENIREGVKTV